MSNACNKNDMPLTKKQTWISLIAIGLIGTLLLYFQQEKSSEQTEKEIITAEFSLSQDFFTMGTIFKCNFFSDSEETNAQASKIVLEEAKNIERICNIFDVNSEIYKLNETAHEAPFVCSKELWDILQKSREAYTLSQGSFDITAKPLMNLWGFYRKNEKVPNDNEIKEALKLVGLEKVVFDDEKRTVFFPVKGMAFDFGGIAKGIAVDNAVAKIEKLPLNGALINLGGNIRCFGSSKERQNYSIGITNPLKKDEIIEVINLNNQAVATSGDYERFVTIDGKRYGHIMDVRTGYPVDKILSATVVSNSAELSDILSTATFINGVDYAKEVVKKYDDMVIYLLYKENNEVKKLKITK